MHFTYGWLNPAFAYVLSVVGSLVGLHCTTKARMSVDPRQRAWLLVFAAGAIGGTGIWVMHFMAMIGFSVPGTELRYDVAQTAASFLISVLTVGVGLFIVGFGRPSRGKLLVGGVVTGVSVAFMHYTGMSAMRMNGHLAYDTTLVVTSYVVAVIAATVALWCTVVVTGARMTVAAALIMGVAVCGMHYIGMSAARVDLTEHTAPVPGAQVNWFLFPILLLVLLTVIVAVVGAMLAIPAGEFPGPPPAGLSDEPTVDVRGAVDVRAFANGWGTGSRFMPGSSNAGGGLRPTRSDAGRAGARPARR
jgi:NO-binding membrane sensor protein with MHYT domain